MVLCEVLPKCCCEAVHHLENYRARGYLQSDPMTSEHPPSSTNDREEQGQPGSAK